MTTQVSKVEFPGQAFLRTEFAAPKEAWETQKMTPFQMAANDNEVLEIIENHLMNLSHDPKYTDDLILAIQDYIRADNKDNNKSYKALSLLSGLAKVNDGRKSGIYKCVGQIKNDPKFLDLVAKYTPDLQVSGGNERGQVVAVGTTATEVVNAPKSSKGTKGTKTQKPAKEKAPKKEKAAKVLPPLPSMADIAALEAMDRKSLMSAMSAVNQHMTTGVKGNETSDAIKTALAKHVLGVDYTPAPKPAKGSEAPKTHELLDMPTDLQWSEIKNMKFRELQGLAKIFRSHGLYQGNLAGKGITKEALLDACKAAMRTLGHEIIEAPLTPQNPDNATSTIERQSGKLNRQATQALQLDKQGISVNWEEIQAA